MLQENKNGSNEPPKLQRPTAHAMSHLSADLTELRSSPLSPGL
jgi:hypothetical protein